jgi:Prokaryotic E2 family D
MRKSLKTQPLQLPPGVEGETKAIIGILQDQFVIVARDNQKRVITKTLTPGAIRTAFNAQPVDSGWLPENVIRYGSSPKGEWMLGWYPPSVRQCYLDGRKRPFMLPMPGLFFFGQGSSYYLWACKEKTIHPNAILYNAPVPNVNDLGLICWGQNQHPNVNGEVFPQLWQLFWHAPFTDNWANNKSRRHSGSIKKLLPTLAGKRSYPLADLIPLQHRLLHSANVTITQMVEMMARRGGQDA